MKTQKRRRNENKTDYLKRLKLLKGRAPRLVFRKTNKYLISQYIISEEAQDKIIFGITSKRLLKYGWPKESEGGLKSGSAAYFLGLLTGKNIKNKKLESPIIDFGMLRVINGSKPYAFIKGLIDSGLMINTKKESLPKEEDLMKKKEIPFKEIKSKITKQE